MKKNGEVSTTIISGQGFIVNDDPNPYKNSEQYPDPTAHDAIKHMETMDAMEKAKFGKFMHTILCMCDVAGYEVSGRITFIETKTGKIWK